LIHFYKRCALVWAGGSAMEDWREQALLASTLSKRKIHEFCIWGKGFA